MLLRQKRIKNLSKLKGIKEGSTIIPIVKLDDNSIKILKNIGFTDKLEIGEAVLPKKLAL